MEFIKAQWLQLEQRERLILSWGGVLVLLILLYAYIWQPWHKAIAHMETALQPRRESLVWMRQQAEMLQSGGKVVQTESARGGDQSLLSIVEQTAKTNRVQKFIQQIVPGSSPNEVRVVLEQANFNQWLRWIDMLYKQYGINIKQLSAERDEDLPNVAEIRITFERV